MTSPFSGDECCSDMRAKCEAESHAALANDHSSSDVEIVGAICALDTSLPDECRQAMSSAEAVAQEGIMQGLRKIRKKKSTEKKPVKLKLKKVGKRMVKKVAAEKVGKRMVKKFADAQADAQAEAAKPRRRLRSKVNATIAQSPFPKTADALWHFGSGQAECLPDPSRVSVRSWTERGRAMLQVRDASLRFPAIVSLTVSHFFSFEHARYIADNFAQMYTRGFTKDQLAKIKSTLRQTR